jgi:uncharacterized DUF497 family protein
VVGLRFEWDDEKAEANWRKHGIRFEQAKLVFVDPQHRTRPDGRYGYGEHRFQTIGVVQGFCLLLFVVWTVRQDGIDTIRIISARHANPKERRQYDDCTF